jgi:hypothetical protein
MPRAKQLGNAVAGTECRPRLPNLVPSLKSMKNLALYGLLFLLLKKFLDEIFVDRETEHLQLNVIF